MQRAIIVQATLVAALSGIVAAVVWYWPVSSPPPSTASVTVAVPGTEMSVPGAKANPSIDLPDGVQIRFVDKTTAAGIDFKHFDGRCDMEYIMDNTGSGLAWLDYDQDGLMDLFLVQGSAFAPPYPNPPPTCKLYKNLGGGRFRDVTAETGLAHTGCGQGAAVGDIDNDGYPDLFLTCYGKPNVLYHNEPDGAGRRHFVDITARAGLATHPDWRTRPNYSTSAAFLDYDNDGRLDLFVCSYVKIDPANYPLCERGGRRRACAPGRFESTRCLLYRNNGDGTFTDVTSQAGIGQPTAKALGVVALDLDDDGKIDLFVANDGVPNFFFHNLGNGRFEAVGPASGCAVNLQGSPQAYMGVDAGDLDGDGRPDLFVTAFSRETNTFFRNIGRGQFLDVTHGSGLGPPSWFALGFGACFLDGDRDGNLDIVVVNGHVDRHVEEEGEPAITFRQKAQLFRNQGGSRFQEIGSQGGPYFTEPHVGRGLAACDYDNDGHMDLAINNSGESAVLLHNESKTPNHWIRLALRGTKSNRDAVGAKVTLHVGDRRLVRHRKGGGSYLSANDPRLLVGLGTATRVDSVEVRWPSGIVQQLGPLAADRGYLIEEGKSEAQVRL
jgi:enediyne biosynthesis protein E4